MFRFLIGFCAGGFELYENPHSCTPPWRPMEIYSIDDVLSFLVRRSGWVEYGWLELRAGGNAPFPPVWVSLLSSLSCCIRKCIPGRSNVFHSAKTSQCWCQTLDERLPTTEAPSWRPAEAL